MSPEAFFITLNSILLALTFVFCMMAAVSMYRTAGIAKDLKVSMQELSSVKNRMAIFEADFSEKFDQFVKKLGSRERMRAKREGESEDSNTPNVLIPV